MCTCVGVGDRHGTRVILKRRIIGCVCPLWGAINLPFALANVSKLERQQMRMAMLMMMIKGGVWRWGWLEVQISTFTVIVTIILMTMGMMRAEKYRYRVYHSVTPVGLWF